MSRKVDIVDVKRQHRAYDPIPAKFGFGVTIQVLDVYSRTGRFRDLQKAVENRNRMFYLGDPNGTNPLGEKE